MLVWYLIIAPTTKYSPDLIGEQKCSILTANVHTHIYVCVCVYLCTHVSVCVFKAMGIEYCCRYFYMALLLDYIFTIEWFQLHS